MFPEAIGYRQIAGLMLAIFAGHALNVSFALAAEIKPGVRSDEVVIEGNIESGDYVKFRDYISKSKFVGSVYLASPGGNLTEAMRIGRLVRSLNLETTVPGRLKPDLTQIVASSHHLKDTKHNFLCASACFFVFAFVCFVG